MPAYEDLIKLYNGYWDYNDLATQTTPISVPNTSTFTTMTNDGQGIFTYLDQKPTGLGDIWNVSTNQFDFTELATLLIVC